MKYNMSRKTIGNTNEYPINNKYNGKIERRLKSSIVSTPKNESIIHRNEYNDRIMMVKNLIKMNKNRLKCRVGMNVSWN
jgi:hypothetical protein